MIICCHCWLSSWGECIVAHSRSKEYSSSMEINMVLAHILSMKRIWWRFFGEACVLLCRAKQWIILDYGYKKVGDPTQTATILWRVVPFGLGCCEEPCSPQVPKSFMWRSLNYSLWQQMTDSSTMTTHLLTPRWVFSSFDQKQHGPSASPSLFTQFHPLELFCFPGWKNPQTETFCSCPKFAEAI